MNKKLFLSVLLVFVLVIGVSASTTKVQKKGDMSIGIEIGNPDGASLKWQFDNKLSMTTGFGYIIWPFPGLDLSTSIEYMVLKPTFFDNYSRNWWCFLTVGGKLNLGYPIYGSSVAFGLSVPVAFTIQTSEIPIEFGISLSPGYQGSVIFAGGGGGTYFFHSFKMDSTLFVRYRF